MQRSDFSRVIDCSVDPIQLNTDVAGTFAVIGDMIKLVNRDSELQQYNRYYREPRGTSQKN